VPSKNTSRERMVAFFAFSWPAHAGRAFRAIYDAKTICLTECYDFQPEIENNKIPSRCNIIIIVALNQENNKNNEQNSYTQKHAVRMLIEELVPYNY
jgi:hypothetical protein